MPRDLRSRLFCALVRGARPGGPRRRLLGRSPPRGSGGACSEHRRQGARHARPPLEHDRAVAGDLALHLPRPHPIRHQGRPGHDDRVRARPRRELDDVARRHPVDVQAPARRAVPQGLRRADRGGREVQLRAADQAGAGHALRRQPRGDQVDRGRRPLHRADRAQGVRSAVPAPHGRLPAGLHPVEEGGREARRAVQVEPRRDGAVRVRAPRPAREDRAEGVRPVPRRPARRSTRCTGSTCPRTPPS